MNKKLNLVLLLVILQASVIAQQIKVSYSQAGSGAAFTGKVFLYMSKDNRQPKDGGVGIESFPCFSVDVSNIKPGSAIMFDDKAISFPVKLSDIERGAYYVQAVWDRNQGGRAIAASPGNIYSNATRIVLTKNFNESFTILCDQLIPEPGFSETEFIKELKAPSALLSSFHKKNMTVNAAVILPEEYYKEPDRKFPVLFKVSGYGGDYRNYSGNTTVKSKPIENIPCITVYLDGSCSLGHSVYANSDNNGPWGDALINEFIPLLENKFRCNGAKLLTGHSSGGWTVLWLQTQYPSTFTACWSSSPDPVDFRKFQQINLYTDANMYYAADSSLNSMATIAGFLPIATAKLAYQMEHVIYRGEQMHSFDAVFGAKEKNGQPERICNPVTGAINKTAFEHWKKYDISNNLRTNWGKLKPELDGKIRVTIGEQDNFLLQGAVHLLDSEMKKLNANMVFEYFPGDHFTVSTQEYMTKGFRFLAEKYEAWAKKQAK